MIILKNTGYVRKEADPRNHILEAVQPPLASGAIPVSHVTDITPFKLSQNVFMQNQEPSCVAHSVTWAVMVEHWKQTGQVVKLSPRFLYAMCKTVDGLPADAGTYLETALNIAKNYGICEDSYFPNNTDLDVATYSNPALIPPEAKVNALKYKIDSYAFLSDRSVSGLNQAIYQNSIVLIGTDVSDWWWTNTAGKNSWNANDLLPLRPIDATHPEVSGHCVALYAYGEPWNAQTPTNQWLMNWWGIEWAYGGRACFGANYEPTLYEAAVITYTVKNTTPAPVAQVEVVQPQETLLEEVIEIGEKLFDKVI